MRFGTQTMSISEWRLVEKRREYFEYLIQTFLGNQGLESLYGVSLRLVESTGGM